MHTDFYRFLLLLCVDIAVHFRYIHLVCDDAFSATSASTLQFCMHFGFHWHRIYSFVKDHRVIFSNEKCDYLSRTVRAAVPSAAAVVDVFFIHICLDSSKQRADEILLLLFFFSFIILFYFCNFCFELF